MYIVFKFGYIQGKHAEQTCRTNETAAGEAEKLRKRIIDMAGQIGSENRLRTIYAVAHRAFINDRLEVLNERQD